MDELGVTGITHEQLIKVLIESEYRATIDAISSELQYWPTEALARRFYHECGTNGCQTQNDELYNFLEYYSAALNGALDDAQRQIYAMIDDPNYEGQIVILNNATNLLFNPSNQGWFNGVLANTPYGFANKSSIASESEAENIRQRLAYCNSERFAIKYQKSGLFTVFFGTTITTDGAMVYPPAPTCPNCLYL